jgi:hypothetical protein
MLKIGRGTQWIDGPDGRVWIAAGGGNGGKTLINRSCQPTTEIGQMLALVFISISVIGN